MNCTVIQFLMVFNADGHIISGKSISRGNWLGLACRLFGSGAVGKVAKQRNLEVYVRVGATVRQRLNVCCIFYN